MMYVRIIFIFLVNSFYSCKAQQTVYIIDFTKSTRGFQEKVRITKDSVLVQIEDARSNPATQKFSEKLEAGRWSKLNEMVKDLSLAEIPSYKSPSKKRTYDGALHGTLTLTTADGKSFSHGFDDENPHLKLRPLLKCVQEIRAEAMAK